MFATQFGKKLESLCKSVVPGHEISAGDFIDLYFGITQDFEIPWLGDADGTMDLLAVVRQACESQNVHELVDYLHMTTPVLVQDERLLRSICGFSNPLQLAVVIHSILGLCRHDTPFIKMLFDGNQKAIDQLNLTIKNEGLDSSVDALFSKQFTN